MESTMGWIKGKSLCTGMGCSGGGCPVLTDVSGTDSNSICRPGCLSPARDLILCYCFPIILLIFPVTGKMAAFQKYMIEPKPKT